MIFCVSITSEDYAQVCETDRELKADAQEMLGTERSMKLRRLRKGMMIPLHKHPQELQSDGSQSRGECGACGW